MSTVHVDDVAAEPGPDLLARWERASGTGLWVWRQERWYSGRHLFAGFDFHERDFDPAPPTAPPPRAPLGR